MRKATMEVKDLETFCPPGKFTLDYQAVITLVYEDSQTNEKCFHAVRVSIPNSDLCQTFKLKLVDTHYSVTLKESNLQSSMLTLTVIDSQATSTESLIEVPVLADGTLQIGGMKDKLCLGYPICFFLTL